MHRSFYHFPTKHAFDRRTDGQTDRMLIARPRLHLMQRGKKTVPDMTYNVFSGTLNLAQPTSCATCSEKLKI